MAVDGWSHMQLGDFVTLQRGHDLPDEKRRPGNVPILGSFGITGWHNDAKAHGPGVTVGRSGASFGVVSYSAVDYWPLNTALYVTDFHGNDARFAYYFLKTIDFQSYNSGSAQPSLNRNFIHPIPIDVPPISEQRPIGQILGALDDKIEANRRINETLEGVARTVFKSWFVDFDPVRAKVQGRDPGVAASIAALFPDRLVETEKGELPEGWRWSSVGSEMTLAYGKALKEGDRKEGNIPVYGSNGPVGWHSERLAKGPGVIVGRKGNPGTVKYSPTDFFCIDTTFFVEPKRNVGGMIYWWLALEGLNLLSYGSDSAVPGLNRDMAYGLDLISPPESVIRKFHEITKPIIGRKYLSESQSHTLAALRDLLLPKLMSGEIRVKELEQLLNRSGG